MTGTFHNVAGKPMATNWHLLMPSYLCPTLRTNMYTDINLNQHVEKFTSDIFLLWNNGYYELNKFITDSNTVGTTIKSTSQISDNEIPFLDLLIYAKRGTSVH